MVIVLASATCCGKDSILNKLKNDYGFEVCVSDTTRPKREKEVDGIDYHFISTETFLEKLKNKEYLEFRRYETIQGQWLYGLAKSSVAINKNQLVILDAKGFETTVNALGQDNVLGIYIYCDERQRIIRALDREPNNTSPEFFNEIFRRFIDDSSGVFDIMKNNPNIIQIRNNNGELELAVDKVLHIINNRIAK
jgi:guanylate kinase